MPAEYTNNMIINSNEEYTVTFTTSAAALVGGIVINNMEFTIASNVILPTNINDYVEGEMTIDSSSFTPVNAGPLL